MKKLNALLATVACLAAGGALAQAEQWDQTSAFQRSTDMMIPPNLTATILGPSEATPRTVGARMDADDRRAAEFIERTDRMMPEVSQADRSSDPHATTAVPGAARVGTPPDADDRRTAEFIRRTDQMRPD